MTDKKITQLTALTGANAVAGDQLAIVDVSDTTMSASGTTKKIALSELQAAPLSAGTANGVPYLNGSKVLTTGSRFTFDGSTVRTTQLYQTDFVAAGYTSEALENTASNGYTQFLFNVGASGVNGQATISYAPGIFFAMGPSANDTTTPIVFRLNNATEQMRLTSSSLEMKNAGIKFLASQSASADANTLDDYEEGTWTPTQGAGLTVVGAFTSSGTYTKIGRLVTVVGNVNGATSITTANGGNITCGGLPFATSVIAIGSLSVAGINQSGSIQLIGADIYSAQVTTADTSIRFTATYFV